MGKRQKFTTVSYLIAQPYVHTQNMSVYIRTHSCTRVRINIRIKANAFAQLGQSCLFPACAEGQTGLVKYLYELGGDELLMSKANVSTLVLRSVFPGVIQ